MVYKSDFISTDEDPGLRIESFAIIKLRGVSTKLNIIFFHHANFQEIKSDFISTDEDPGLRIESFAIIKLRGVSTKLNIIVIK